MTRTHPAFTRGPLAALMASTALTAAVMSAPTVAAGIPVFDGAVAAIMQNEAVITAKGWITQGAQMVRTIGQGVEVIQQGGRIIQQGEQVYRAATDPTYLMNYAMGLVRRELRSPMSADTNMVRDAISGQLGFEFSSSLGVGGFLGGVLGQIPYNPEGDDPAAQQMRERAGAAAAQQDLALTGYDASTRRIEGLQEIAGEIGKENSSGARQDLQTRATVEMGFAQAQTNQLLALQLAGQAEERRQTEKTRLLARRSADQVIAESDRIIAARGTPAAASPMAVNLTSLIQ